VIIETVIVVETVLVDPPPVIQPTLPPLPEPTLIPDPTEVIRGKCPPQANAEKCLGSILASRRR
jgi:hypothetical protein